MEHPLIFDADSLNNDELASKISDLNKKLSIARRMGNSYLVGQVTMAIASYQQAYTRKLQDQIAKDKPNLDRISNKIDIS